MGTWDTAPFDNDTAADFAHTLDDAAAGERIGILRDALFRAINCQVYLDSDLGAEAVAAAALIASQIPGGEPMSTSYEPKQPLPQHPADLRVLATQALDRVVTKPSELLSMWGETDRTGLWRASILQLRNVLVSQPESDNSA